MRWSSFRVFLALLMSMPVFANAVAAERRCLTECSPRIGVVSAFGAEADILIAQTQNKRAYQINGNRFTTGVLRGNPVVIVLSGVSMINGTMVTQLMIDHFRIQRLIMSGIAGGIDPSRHVGDVLIPERWAMPMEVYWNANSKIPAPCGAESDVSCLGLELAKIDGKLLPDFKIPTPQGPVSTGLFMRSNFVMNTSNSPKGEFRFDYTADSAMMAVARSIKPNLLKCGPKKPSATSEPLCVATQPTLMVGGRAISGTAFLANPDYRTYLFDTLKAQAVDMETAALAHVAYANRIPYIAMRSLSDLAGGDHTQDVGVFFGSGLAEHNASAVTLAFLEAWRRMQKK
jgi:adenosylhomocysteine nucleosidase